MCASGTCERAELVSESNLSAISRASPNVMSKNNESTTQQLLAENRRLNEENAKLKGVIVGLEKGLEVAIDRVGGSPSQKLHTVSTITYDLF